eukprot:7368299-Prymnesium_polylepis.1
MPKARCKTSSRRCFACPVDEECGSRRVCELVDHLKLHSRHVQEMNVDQYLHMILVGPPKSTKT